MEEIALTIRQGTPALSRALHASAADRAGLFVTYVESLVKAMRVCFLRPRRIGDVVELATTPAVSVQDLKALYDEIRKL